MILFSFLRVCRFFVWEVVHSYCRRVYFYALNHKEIYHLPFRENTDLFNQFSRKGAAHRIKLTKMFTKRLPRAWNIVKTAVKFRARSERFIIHIERQQYSWVHNQRILLEGDLRSFGQIYEARIMYREVMSVKIRAAVLQCRDSAEVFGIFQSNSRETLCFLCPKFSNFFFVEPKLMLHKQAKLKQTSTSIYYRN